MLAMFLRETGNVNDYDTGQLDLQSILMDLSLPNEHKKTYLPDKNLMISNPLQEGK
jgi:hypothetical protein